MCKLKCPKVYRMNPQDPVNSKICNDDISDEDLGIYVFSDSECDEIEQVLKICKYCIITTVVGIGIGLIFYIVKKYD